MGSPPRGGGVAKRQRGAVSGEERPCCERGCYDAALLTVVRGGAFLDRFALGGQLAAEFAGGKGKV